MASGCKNIKFSFHRLITDLSLEGFEMNSSVHATVKSMRLGLVAFGAA